MFISLKAMGFNSVFNFLKIPFHVYFSFQPCFCFFPCIIFCPIVSFFILLILSSFRVFGLFLFFMPLRIFCPFPLSTICVWLFLPSRFGFSLSPPDMVLSVCLVLSLSSVHTLSYLTIPSSLHAHYFSPNIKQSSLFFVEWDIFFFPTHRSWNIVAFSPLLLPLKTLVPAKGRAVVGDSPSHCTG